MYEYAFEQGIPDSSCMQYTAQNLVGAACTPFDICRDCSPPAPAWNETGLENCRAISEFKHYYVSSYYEFKGADQMKAEIYANGPISCGIMATDKFEAYAGGIYSEKSSFP